MTSKAQLIGPSCVFRTPFTEKLGVDRKQSHALCTPQGQENPEAYSLLYPKRGPRAFPKKPMVPAQGHSPGQADRLEKVVYRGFWMKER